MASFSGAPMFDGDLLMDLGRVRHHDDDALDQLEQSGISLRLDEGVEGLDRHGL